MSRSYVVKSSGIKDWCAYILECQITFQQWRFGATKVKLQRKNLSSTFSYQNTKRFDAQKFVDDLSKAPWDTTVTFEDSEDIVDS